MRGAGIVPRPRKFDHDEARRLRACGHSYRAIGSMLNVSAQSVMSACDPDYRERSRQSVRNNQPHIGICPSCGGRCTNGMASQKYLPNGELRICIACRKRQRVLNHARDGELKCYDCKVWKEDEAFGSCGDRPTRRNRRLSCRECERNRSRQRRAAAKERAAGPVPTTVDEPGRDE